MKMINVKTIEAKKGTKNKFFSPPIFPKIL